MSSNGEEIRVYPDRFSMWFVAAASFAFLTGGILITIAVGLQELGIFIGGIVVFGTLFFGWVFVFAMACLLGRKPLLIIGKEGLFDNTSPLAAGFIRWEEISGIFSLTAGTAYIGITIKEPQLFLSRQPLIKGIVMRINKLLFKASVFLPTALMSISAEKLLSDMRTFSNSVK